ncbi:MAG: CPBP family intramembrane glutamic endopeptidase [bacterium]
MTFDKKKTLRFLGWAFGLGWLMEFGTAALYLRGEAGLGQLCMTLTMFAPLAAAALSGFGLRGIGWGLRLKGKLQYLAASWFFPTVLTALGAGLYFLLFPSHLELTGAALPAEAREALAAQGITFPTYLLIGLFSTLLYIPLLNAIPAAGEEIGWRGILYPQLKARFGRGKGRILGGLIWGAWHWPLIALIGYEYGVGYPGFPVTGMLLFCLFTVAFGILCDWVYEKSGSIWLPAICHGALNGAATIPVYMAEPTRVRTLLGPTVNGLIGGLPLLLLACFLLWREREAA